MNKIIRALCFKPPLDRLMGASAMQRVAKFAAFFTCGNLIYFLAIPLTAHPAHAGNFTVSNYNDNPFFYNGTSSDPDDTRWSLSAPDSNTTVTDWAAPGNSCLTKTPVTACVEFINAQEAIIYTGEDTDSITTWTSSKANLDVPGDSGYVVTFKAEFTQIVDETYYYQIGTQSRVELVNNQTISKRVIGSERLSFIIDSPSGFGELTISNFSTSAVPAPLPAAGAATAFGYSRRLRRRIKGKVPSKLKQSRTPSYPGAYLNLPPLALQAIPLTFNYQAGSVGRFSMVASASSSSGFTSH